MSSPRREGPLVMRAGATGVVAMFGEYGSEPPT
jgi:hypothetical protein